MVRIGHHAEREVTTAAGAVPVRAPLVNDKRIEEPRQHDQPSTIPGEAQP